MLVCNLVVSQKFDNLFVHNLQNVDFEKLKNERIEVVKIQMNLRDIVDDENLKNDLMGVFDAVSQKIGLKKDEVVESCLTDLKVVYENVIVN